MAFPKSPGKDDSPDRQFTRDHYCNRCPQSFKTIDELNEHCKESHYICKYFYCTMCRIVYTDHQPFQAHLATCPGKTYMCNFVNCGETFGELSLLEAHVITHRTGPILPEPGPSGSTGSTGSTRSTRSTRSIGSTCSTRSTRSTRSIGSTCSTRSSSPPGGKRRKLLPKVSVEAVPLQISDGDIQKSIMDRCEENKSTTSR